MANYLNRLFDMAGVSGYDNSGEGLDYASVPACLTTLLGMFNQCCLYRGPRGTPSHEQLRKVIEDTQFPFLSNYSIS
jgi:hypothetical protein